MYRFPRQVRLFTASQFQNVFRSSLVSKDNNFRVKAAFNRENHPRLGLAVSRRVNKRAVERNRIKRVVRESFRRNKEHMGGLDIVIVAMQGASRADNQQLQASIDWHWQQLAETVKKGGTQTGARQENTK